MNTDRKLRGAIVGAGFMGQTHLEGYSRLEHVSLDAVIDPSRAQAEKVAGKYGAKPFCSIEDATSELSLDFIDICAPTPFHANLIDSAFRNHCHVIVEKPIAAGMDDLQRIKVLAKQTDRRIMVAQVCRFMGIYLYAKQTVDSGRLGKPYAFSAKRYIDLPSWSVDNWINDKKMSGGTLVDLSIHDIDISNWLFGKPVRLNASEVTNFPGGPAHLMETLEYANGIVSHIEGSHLLPQGFPLRYEYELLFEKGIISGGAGAIPAFVKEFSNGSWQEIDPQSVVTWQDPYTEELNHFTKALLTGDAFRISLEDAYDAVQTAFLLQSSIDVGNRVPYKY